LKIEKYFAVLLLVGASLSPATAATLADIKAQVEAASGELAEVDALLADPDPNKRLAAIQMLLASDNGTWVKRAKEVGLFSDDAEMQRAVVTAILETGGPFRADITLGDEKRTGIRQWIKNHDGNVDEANNVAHVVIKLNAYSAEDKCWPFGPYGNNCAFIPAGETYSLDDWDDANGTVRLDADGALAGLLTTRNGQGDSVAIRIPLAE